MRVIYHVSLVVMLWRHQSVQKAILLLHWVRETSNLLWSGGQVRGSMAIRHLCSKFCCLMASVDCEAAGTLPNLLWCRECWQVPAWLGLVFATSEIVPGDGYQRRAPRDTHQSPTLIA